MKKCCTYFSSDYASSFYLDLYHPQHCLQMVSSEQTSLYLGYKVPCNTDMPLEKHDPTAGVWLVPHCSLLVYSEKNSSISHSFLIATQKPILVYCSLYQARQDLCVQYQLWDKDCKPAVLFSTVSLSKTFNSVVFTKKYTWNFFFIRYILFSRKNFWVILIVDTHYIFFGKSTVSPSSIRAFCSSDAKGLCG